MVVVVAVAVDFASEDWAHLGKWLLKHLGWHSRKVGAELDWKKNSIAESPLDLHDYYLHCVDWVWAEERRVAVDLRLGSRENCCYFDCTFVSCHLVDVADVGVVVVVAVVVDRLAAAVSRQWHC